MQCSLIKIRVVLIWLAPVVRTASLQNLREEAAAKRGEGVIVVDDVGCSTIRKGGGGGGGVGGRGGRRGFSRRIERLL